MAKFSRKIIFCGVFLFAIASVVQAKTKFGPIGSNINLWRLSSHVASSEKATKQQIMIAILKKNPKAFMKNNVNNLKKGSVLLIPTLAEIKKTSPREALLLVMAQNRKWEQPAGYHDHLILAAKEKSPKIVVKKAKLPKPILLARHAAPVAQTQISSSQHAMASKDTTASGDLYKNLPPLPNASSQNNVDDNAPIPESGPASAMNQTLPNPMTSDRVLAQVQSPFASNQMGVINVPAVSPTPINVPIPPVVKQLEKQIAKLNAENNQLKMKLNRTSFEQHLTVLSAAEQLSFPPQLLAVSKVASNDFLHPTSRSDLTSAEMAHPSVYKLRIIAATSIVVFALMMFTTLLMLSRRFRGKRQCVSEKSNKEYLTTEDAIATKLDLARAYIDMGDQKNANNVLRSVLEQGNSQQRVEAKQLRKQLNNKK